MNPWRRAAAVSLISITSAAVGACDVVDPPGCDVCTTSAVVYGQVRDESGAPVPGAAVRVEAFFADAGRGPVDVPVAGTNVTARTDAAGRYRDRPLAPSAPFRARLVVRVTPPPATGLPEAFAAGAEVEFRDDYGGATRDSVRVDVVVARGAAP